MVGGWRYCYLFARYTFNHEQEILSIRLPLTFLTHLCASVFKENFPEPFILHDCALSKQLTWCNLYPFIRLFHLFSVLYDENLQNYSSIGKDPFQCSDGKFFDALEQQWCHISLHSGSEMIAQQASMPCIVILCQNVTYKHDVCSNGIQHNVRPMAFVFVVGFAPPKNVGPWNMVGWSEMEPVK